MSGGGKGGSQTSTTQVAIPDYLEEPIKRNIAKAEEFAKIGFVPYSGPVVAAMTPMQEAAMQGTSMAAQAYGLPSAAGQQISPEPQTFAGGFRGYSTMPLYEQALEELRSTRPGQYAALTAPFIDPFTGQPINGAATQSDASSAGNTFQEYLRAKLSGDPVYARQFLDQDYSLSGREDLF